MDEAVARLHAEHGETVYVRRFLSTQPDLIYQEDLTRTEEVFRTIGVVQRNPGRRVLERHGRELPVDLLVTFGFNDLNAAVSNIGNQDLAITRILEGYHLVYKGVRHQVVQVEQTKVQTGADGPGAGECAPCPDLPATLPDPISDTDGQVAVCAFMHVDAELCADFIQLHVLAIIQRESDLPDIHHTEQEQPDQPEIVDGVIDVVGDAGQIFIVGTLVVAQHGQILASASVNVG